MKVGLAGDLLPSQTVELFLARFQHYLTFKRAPCNAGWQLPCHARSKGGKRGCATQRDTHRLTSSGNKKARTGLDDSLGRSGRAVIAWLVTELAVDCKPARII
ncbi:MAG: hypothetical protein ACFFD4_40060 [Candidatus Odinarchaeota archaeon]